MRNLLMVFIKNPVLGKVKTRLAKTIGDERALAVYKILLQHTLAITNPLAYHKIVYYSDFIPEIDEWTAAGFNQALQQGADLGERMERAFIESFSLGYERVLIIGSDCYELSTAILQNAFESLNENEAVIGPAHDGGYYLLGMNTLYAVLFKDKEWSTSSVLRDTVKNLIELKVSYKLLPALSDIDNEADLKLSEIDLV